MVKRILVPLDRSALAESVVPIVMDTARGAQAVVRLLHVAPEPTNQTDAGGRVVAYSDQEMERLRNEGLDYLHSVEAQFSGIFIESAVRFGDPVGEILRDAEDFGADLIAAGTAGRSGFHRALLGSVAQEVFRKAEIPVMLVKGAAPRTS